MPRTVSFLVLLALSLAACSGPKDAAPRADGAALAIDRPPSGPLSGDQLRAIATDIRQLEARPLAPGAREGRRNLLVWITESPDVSVSICQEVAGFTGPQSPYRAELLGQFIYSSAAYAIENEGADAVAVNVGGLQGTLVTYRALLEREGRRARDSFMESVAELSEAGQLESYVRSGLADC